MPRYTPLYKYNFGHTFDALPEFAKDYLQHQVTDELESPEDVLAYAANVRAFLVLTLWRIVQKDQRSPEEQLRNMWNELNRYLINFDALIWLQTETQARREGKDYKFQGYNEYQGYTYEDQGDTAKNQGDSTEDQGCSTKYLQQFRDEQLEEAIVRAFALEHRDPDAMDVDQIECSDQMRGRTKTRNGRSFHQKSCHSWRVF